MARWPGYIVNFCEYFNKCYPYYNVTGLYLGWFLLLHRDLFLRRLVKIVTR